MLLTVMRMDRDDTIAGNSSPNRLVHEKSRYLLDHAYQPVDWYPWGDDAFDAAQSKNKPIFLSIGYSTCHWCHVMARESFEDAEVAALLNDVFICVKVDREERPDIDAIYMTAAHLLGGRAGWPLTIVMTPDKRPFFAASYIPKENQFGMTGLLDLIPKIRDAWTTRREELVESGARVLEFIEDRMGAPGTGAADADLLDQGYEALRRSFDHRHGGFGTAPKFPTPQHLFFLLRYGARTGDADAYDMVEQTLRSMRRGGIYDHIGFGFHRYSTDAEWSVPHFEKMLSDQALLAIAYTDAYLALGEDEFRRTAGEIIAYVQRVLTDPGGGFYTAEDADSEGVEGKYYLWTLNEIRDLLGDEDGDLFARIFDVSEGGNFSPPAGDVKQGASILRMRKDPADRAARSGMTEDELWRFIESSRKTLLEARNSRIRPRTDDKILADWNGLMIAALARAARALGSDEYLRAAERAARFVLSRMRDGGRLLHRYRDGAAGIMATVDDYAFMIWGLIELYQAGFDAGYLAAARDFQQEMLDHYLNPADGGFYLTADDAPDVPVRHMVLTDGAGPAANSIAIHNLLVLGRITSRPEFGDEAHRAIRSCSGRAQSMPEACTSLLSALDRALHPGRMVVIAGVPGDPDVVRMVQAVHSRFMPDTIVLFRPSDRESPEITSLAPFTRDAVAHDGRATAYVCRTDACELPTTDVRELLRILESQQEHFPG